MSGITLDSYQQHLQQLPQSILKQDTVTSILLMGSRGKKKARSDSPNTHPGEQLNLGALQV